MLSITYACLTLTIIWFLVYVATGTFMFVLIIFSLLTISALCGDIWSAVVQKNVISKRTARGVMMSRLGRKGQLGNQLFQLGAAYTAACRYKVPLILDPRVKETPLGILFSDSLSKMASFNKSLKTNTWFEKAKYEPIRVGGITDIRGYFEDMRYCDLDLLRKNLKPNEDILERVRALLPEKYIVVHVRHGDNEPWYHSIPIIQIISSLYTPSWKYFSEAVRASKLLNGKLPIIVCTDNRAYVEPHLTEIDLKATFSPNVEGIPGMFVDWCILYLSTGAVISGSTFSWWGAALSSDKIIVRPGPLTQKGHFIDLSLGRRGEHQQLPLMITLDGMTGEPMEDLIDSQPKLATGWTDVVLAS